MSEQQKKTFDPHCAEKQQVDRHDSVKEQICASAEKLHKLGETVLMSSAEDDAHGASMHPTPSTATFVTKDGTVSTGREKMKADLKQEEHNITFWEELNKKLSKMTDKTQKAYALNVNNCCSEVMRNEIEEKTDFETVESLKRTKECVRIPT